MNTEQLEKLHEALAAAPKRYAADEIFIKCVIGALRAYEKGHTTDHTEVMQFALLGHQSRDAEVKSLNADIAARDWTIAALQADKAELVEALDDLNALAIAWAVLYSIDPAYTEQPADGSPAPFHPTHQVILDRAKALLAKHRKEA